MTYAHSTPYSSDMLNLIRYMSGVFAFHALYLAFSWATCSGLGPALGLVFHTPLFLFLLFGEEDDIKKVIDEQTEKMWILIGGLVIYDLAGVWGVIITLVAFGVVGLREMVWEQRLKEATVTLAEAKVILAEATVSQTTPDKPASLGEATVTPAKATVTETRPEPDSDEDDENCMFRDVDYIPPRPRTTVTRPTPESDGEDVASELCPFRHFPAEMATVTRDDSSDLDDSDTEFMVHRRVDDSSSDDSDDSDFDFRSWRPRALASSDDDFELVD